jgi:hypothetical protein
MKTTTTVANEIQKLSKEEIEQFANEKGISVKELSENTEALFLLSQRKDINESIDKIQLDVKEPQSLKNEMLTIKNEEKTDIETCLDDLIKGAIEKTNPKSEKTINFNEFER